MPYKAIGAERVTHDANYKVAWQRMDRERKKAEGIKQKRYPKKRAQRRIFPINPVSDPAPAPPEFRERIDKGLILAALQQHIVGKKALKPTQITAALGLLRKVMPDLQATKHEGTVPLTLQVLTGVTRQPAPTAIEHKLDDEIVIEDATSSDVCNQDGEDLG